MIQCGQTNSQDTLSAVFTDSFRPVIRQERLSFQVADQIGALIRVNDLQPGARLPPERDLCQRFAVSRSVIREAISILVAKGLLTSKGGSGTFVRAMQVEDVADSIGLYISTQSQSVSLENLIEIRRVLEVQIARLAAERSAPEDITELARIMAACREVTSDADAFATLDLEFHVALARITRNPLFEILLEPFADALYEARRLASELPGVIQEAMDLHSGILDRVKAHDAEGAARAMSRHLDQSRRVTMRALQGVSGSATD